MNTKELREILENIDVLNPWRVEERIGEALAELDYLEAERKVLTDEEIAEAAAKKYGKPFADFIINVKPEQLCRLAFIAGAHYARDNGYLAPAPSQQMLTVEQAYECLVEHLSQYGADWHEQARYRLRARLTAAAK